MKQRIKRWLTSFGYLGRRRPACIDSSSEAEKEHQCVGSSPDVVEWKEDVAMDFTEMFPEKLSANIFHLLDLRTRIRLELVSKRWQKLIWQSYDIQQRSVWVYTMFRAGRNSGHEKLHVRITHDGPIFWSNLVIYIYLCSCHFSRHERALLGLLIRVAPLIQRFCLVDCPVGTAFMPDSFFAAVIANLPKVVLLYLREMDLAKISDETVDKLTMKQSIRQIVLHDCLHCESLVNSIRLHPRLTVVSGPLNGLTTFLAAVESPEKETSASELFTQLTSLEGLAKTGEGGAVVNTEVDGGAVNVVDTVDPVTSALEIDG